MTVFYGTKFIDVLVGDKTDDVLLGDDGGDILYGKGGNDVLKGGGGGDTLFGGEGFDTADYGDSWEGVRIYLGNEHIGKGGTAAGDTFDSVENANGSPHGDEIWGDSKDNTLSGGQGDDFLQGWWGDDTLYGGDHDDTLVGYVGEDYMDGGDGIDTAVFVGGTQEKPEGVHVSLKHGFAHGADAAGDTLVDIENLYGGWGNDGLWGDDGDNHLNGWAGDDLLKGYGGADRLEGSWGQDHLVGGEGSDTFVWTYANETDAKKVELMDVIQDFTFDVDVDGDRDVIDLSGIDADTTTPWHQNEAFTFIGTDDFSGKPGEVRYYHLDGNTIISMQTGEIGDPEAGIVLWGLHDPTEDWFIL
jgi:Ca2+-binding RTX toxin-like protein